MKKDFTNTQKADFSEVEKEILTLIKSKGDFVANLVKNHETPYFEMKSRSPSNIQFSISDQKFVVKNKKTRFLMTNQEQVQKFTQILWVLKYASELIRSGRTETLKGLFYSSEAFQANLFEDQIQSDNVIIDTETLLGYSREDFHINPSSRGTIYGDVDIQIIHPTSGKSRHVNLGINPDGQAIGLNLIRANFVDTSAEKVIAVESDGMFNRLIEENVPEDNKVILIGLMGQASRGVRRLLRKFSDPQAQGGLNLPVFIFTDADVWGLHMFQVCKFGSLETAHLEGLTCPNAHWIGVRATDIETFDLPFELANKKDLKRCRDLLYGAFGPPLDAWKKKEEILKSQNPKGSLFNEEKLMKKKSSSKSQEKVKYRYLLPDPRYSIEIAKKEREELFNFWCIQRKSSQQAFNAKGSLNFVVQEFLPARIKELGFSF